MHIEDAIKEIERDWQGAERLIDSMGLKDFLRVVAQMAKQDDKLRTWLRETLPPMYVELLPPKHVEVLVTWFNPNQDLEVVGVFENVEAAKRHMAQEKMNPAYCQIVPHRVRG
jgi:hypothetical protein